MLPYLQTPVDRVNEQTKNKQQLHCLPRNPLPSPTLTEKVGLVGREDSVHAAHESDRQERRADEHTQRDDALKKNERIKKQGRA